MTQQNINPQLRAIAIYMLGFYDGVADTQDSMNGHLAPAMLPPFLHQSLREALDYYAAQDEVEREGAALEAGDFEKWGKWHRAVNLLMHALDKKAKDMTEATHEYAEGIVWGDVLHKCLMQTQRRNYSEPLVD